VGRSLSGYKSDLGALAAELTSPPAVTARNASANAAGTKFIWLQPTTVVTERLVSDEKRAYMNEAVIQQSRAAFAASPAAPLFDTVIDGTKATASKLFKPVDGIHYTDDVYQVLAHMVSNGYTAHFPALASPAQKTYTPKPTGSMSFPALGAVILALGAIMLFTMDSFLGIGFLTLLLFGRSYDWEAAYGGLHRKILGAEEKAARDRPEPAVVPSGGREAAAEGLENDSLLDARTNL
jgi:hypothetical protein